MKCQHQKGFYQQPDRSNDLIYLRKKSTAGMVPMSYRQVLHPPTLLSRPQYGAESQSNKVMHDQGPWACDYCQVATFDTYNEAMQHEQTCAMNQNILGTASQSMSRVEYTSHSSKESQSALGLSIPGDKDCLSDRQCYVRSHFVELFAASDTDVASRHSKGAQKLHVGQIGIRCKHCKHLRNKDRAERAICYPSSISRIYQTVADMQRFHFSACEMIPSEMKNFYKTLKTTRPRGVGSPQAYWISSAKQLGLADSNAGIRYNPSRDQPLYLQYAAVEVSSFSSMSTCSSNHSNVTPQRRQVTSSPVMMPSTTFPPLSPESQSTSQSLTIEQSEGSDFEMIDRDCEANMLLALKKSKRGFTNQMLDSDSQ